MNFQKQKGVALVVGLVMLLVLTLMGVSSMRNTTTELKIACNSQTHNDAFQAAMSCVNSAITQVDVSNTALQTINCSLVGSNTTAVVEMKKVGCNDVFGESLGGAGSQQVVFELKSSAKAVGCGGEAFSNIVQAVGIKAAMACGGNI